MQAKNTDISIHRGHTVRQINDHVFFGKVKVTDFQTILIHAGTNDIAQLIQSGSIKTALPQHILQYYVSLRQSIRRRNSHAILLFSSILPRVQDFHTFFPYVFGINFALEKWCAQSKGTCIFVPSYTLFLKQGLPKAHLFSEKDGLHLNGAGMDVLESCFQQALTVPSMLEKVSSRRVKKLSLLPY